MKGSTTTSPKKNYLTKNEKDWTFLPNRPMVFSKSPFLFNLYSKVE